MPDPKPPVQPPRKNPFIKTMKLTDFKPDQTLLDKFCGESALKQLVKPPPPETPRGR